MDSGSGLDFLGPRDFKLDIETDTIEHDPALSEEYRDFLESNR